MKARILIVWAVLTLLAAPLFARPGGGERFGGSSPSPAPYSPSPAPAPAPYSSPPSYSSPSDYSGSSGGGGGGSPFVVLLFVALSIGVAVFRKVAESSRQDWQTAQHMPVQRWMPAPPPPPPRQLARHTLSELLAARDPDFSMVLFEDFLYSLFAAYHEARGGSGRHDVRPYVEGDAARYLTTLRKDEVRSVIVGAMQITRARIDQDRVAVEVSFEANYEEVEGGAAQAYYVREKWVLQRALSVRSRPPEHSTIDECPNCGGPLRDMDGNVCAYCHEALTPGRFDWVLTHVEVERETRGPMLTGAVAEVGTSLPTIVVAGAKERYAALTARDTSFSWPAFQRRVAVIFAALHRGWCARDWRSVRPYVSDQLFQSQLYWIEEYTKQRLNNRTDGARIVEIAMSNVESDKHFDAITVRLFATGKDYTVTEDGKLVSGSQSIDRAYSEYWTLIRGRSVNRPAHLDASCPNCGAPLVVSMAGSCTHCQVKVTRGDFDWVLSRIEQDETYG